jgi:RimJ/RimL family protein N-acetyltransferase
MDDPHMSDTAETIEKTFVVDGVIINDNARVAAHIHTILNRPVIAQSFQAFGIIVDDKLVGGCYFYNHDPIRGDIDMAVAVEDKVASEPLKLREQIRRILHYPFNQLSCKRITAYIELSNERAIRQAMQLGFIQNGVKAETGVGIFGLNPTTCPFWVSE